MSDLPVFQHTFTAGDRLPEILGTLDGVDLTDYVVEFTLIRNDGTAVEKSTATSGVVFVVPAEGTFKITWETTDLVAGLCQKCQIRFINSGSMPMTSRDFSINVKEKLAE